MVLLMVITKPLVAVEAAVIQAHSEISQLLPEQVIPLSSVGLVVRLVRLGKVLTVVHLSPMEQQLVVLVVLVEAAEDYRLIKVAMVVQTVAMAKLRSVTEVPVKAPPLVNLVKQVLRYMLVEAEAAQEAAKLVMAVLAVAVTETLAPPV